MGITITSQYNTASAPLLNDSNGDDLNSSSVLGIIGGVKAGLKNLQDPLELLYGNFLTKDLSRSVAPLLTGTLSGTAVVAAGRLSIIGNGQWTIDPTGTLGTDTSVRTIRFKYIPQYSGATGSIEYIFREESSAPSGGNRILIRHIGTQIQIQFRQTGGGGKGTLVVPFLPIANQAYEFELNMNTSVANDIRFFIDGVLMGTHVYTPYTRLSATDIFRIGWAGGPQNFHLDDLQVFDEVKHTANYATEIPRTVNQTTYPVGEQTIEPILCSSPFCVKAQVMTLFSAMIDETGGSVGIVTVKDGADFYNNSGDWIVSDGSLSQSNSQAQINANISTLITPPGEEIHFKIIISSLDGSQTPSITSQTFEFEYYFSPIDPSKCQIWGHVYDNCKPVSGAVVSFLSRRMFDDANGNFVNINESITTSTDGYFSILLAKSENFDESIGVIISFTDLRGEQIERTLTINVPNLNEAPLDSIIV